MDAGSRVQIDSLAKSYGSAGRRIRALQDVNLTVEPGERVAITGVSGSGKSTLLHLVGGLDRPTTGRIWFDAIEITGLEDSQLAAFRNRQVGFVWQAPSLLPEFTAVENVIMPLLIRGEARSTAMREAEGMLEAVELSQRASHRAGELSGGEQQRIVLARALITRPKVLLADEPTGSLDAETGERIAGLLDELHALYRFSAILVTHNPLLAQRCERRLKLDHGCLHDTDELVTVAAGTIRDATRLGGGTYV